MQEMGHCNRAAGALQHLGPALPALRYQAERGGSEAGDSLAGGSTARLGSPRPRACPTATRAGRRAYSAATASGARS